MTNLKGTAQAEKFLTHSKGKLVDTFGLFIPSEPQEEFFLRMEREDTLEVLLAGGVRSGKSTAAAIAFASMLLDRPITFRDGSQHHMRPARWRGEALKIWCVGHNWTHIGKTFYRLLFAKGLFRVIRDQKTGKWRAWDPLLPGESEQFNNTRMSPPLIRMDNVVDGESGLSWENKKGNQLNACDFVDGSRMELFPSTGALPKGDPVHFIWIDENIEDDRWYPELLSRLVDYRGRLVWTTYPGTQPSAAMGAVEERAKEDQSKKAAKAYHIILAGADNPYTKSSFRDGIMDTMDEDERAARDRGVSNMDRWRMYPRFNKYVHRAYGPDESKDDELAKILRKGVPADWTRYLILDPGTSHPFVLFVAFPPPSIGDFIVPYDEIASPMWAEPLAKAAAAKLGITQDSDGDVIEEMIADFQACRQVPMGFAGTIGQNYEHYFNRERIKSRRRGCRFSPGASNPLARMMKLQGAMNLRSDGSTRLRILGCPNLVKQLERAKVAADPKGNPTDEPAKWQVIDGVNCLEYLVSREDCVYFQRAEPVQKTRWDGMAIVNSINTKLGIKKPPVKASSVLCGAAES